MITKRHHERIYLWAAVNIMAYVLIAIIIWSLFNH
jgi:hypothetical protein